ncbi:phage tail protein [Pragia fontium]|uniref:phage tail protein n=1 Tax=Pragia fontium TaxID=82985 RepID=UPI000F6F5577|nr:phage tail protein [Pragia fontium]VEJ54297.1 Phage tail fibre repeat [Pragia fontium]
MAFTIEQEQALLALLNEKKITLSELPAATELAADDLLLMRQGILDKSVNNDVLKAYFTPPESSLIESGIVKLSNAINSDDEYIAATSKAVKSAHNIALNASQSVAEQALSKSANLSDVADKEQVLKNLGLLEAASRSGITALNDKNGWLSIPVKAMGKLSNVIIQWGTVTLPLISDGGIGEWRQSSTSFSFPISFPNACFSTGCSLLHGGSSTQWVAIASASPSTRTTGRALIQTRYPLETNPSITWIAIGY